MTSERPGFELPLPPHPSEGPPRIHQQIPKIAQQHSVPIHFSICDKMSAFFGLRGD